VREIDRLRAILAEPEAAHDVIVGELEDIKRASATAPHRDRRRRGRDQHRGPHPGRGHGRDRSRTSGYVKRTPVTDYRAQKRGGKGKVGMEARDEDWVSQLFVASTHAYVFFFSDKGKVYVKKVYEIPEGARNARAARS
jgi:DNA gyrase subunit A